MVYNMTDEPKTFIIGRKGIVFLVSESGRRSKCGFRIAQDPETSDCRIEVFDRATSSWLPLPEQIQTQDGKIVSVVLFGEGN